MTIANPLVPHGLGPHKCSIPFPIPVHVTLSRHKPHSATAGYYGVNHSNLKPLNRVSRAADTPTTVLTSCALINARSVRKKSFILNNLFSSNSLDILFVTETWIQPGMSAAFTDLLPPDCSVINSPRMTGRAGGIATIFKNSFYCKPLSPPSFSSFELSLFELRRSDPVLCAVIYRPPNYNKDFIEEFSEFLAGVLIKYNKLLMVGDLNVHVCCMSKPLAKDFLEVLDSFNLIQHVTEPTHELGHTLDLVISLGLTISNIQVRPPIGSDHFPLFFDLLLPCDVFKLCAAARQCRGISPATARSFSSVFNNIAQAETVSCDGLNTEQLTSNFLSTCGGILNTVAPLKTKRPRPRSEPWLNDTTRTARRECRKAERRWKKDKLLVSHVILKECWKTYQSTVKTEKTRHFSDLISKNVNKPRVLFRTIDQLLNPPQPTCLEASPEICEKFLSHFIDKVTTIRAQISPPASDPSIVVTCTSIFNHFNPLSLLELSELVNQLKISSCPTDVIPTHLFKEVWETIGPSVLQIINSSLASGVVPLYFKKAVVTPLIKKTNLDTSILANYRPISKLPFISKILEKTVLVQLQSFLHLHNILDVFQSGFKAFHSTESALLRVLNDILWTTDQGDSAILVLLDLSSAFDTLHHETLLSRLNLCVGVGDTVLKWFSSYLSERCFSVKYGDSVSSTTPLPYGVPQGSILGPILFSLYLLPLGQIFRKHGIAYHLYADDSQIYMPLKLNNNSSLSPLLSCLNDIKAWLSLNFLCLNESKTEVIVFGPNGPGILPADLGSLQPYIKTVVSNLGVKLDNGLNLDKQISAVVSSSFYHLRLLSQIKSVLSFSDFERVIHAFISTRLDYCNALYAGLNKGSIARLQLVQNAAARLLTGTRRREHITPVLASLHWLPVRFRIDFKILLFVFKSLNGLAPEYLAELLKVYEPPRNLRSTGQLQLTPLTAEKRTRGDRAFSVIGPTLWNALPLQIRFAPTVASFKTRLKTHLYAQAFSFV